MYLLCLAQGFRSGLGLLIGIQLEILESRSTVFFFSDSRMQKKKSDFIGKNTNTKCSLPFDYLEGLSSKPIFNLKKLEVACDTTR